jgi:hypothetical protein
MISIEKQRRQARNIKRMNHKLKSFGTSKVLAPDAQGQRTECTSKEDIEQGCQEENSQRFSQTKDTPFMSSPLVDDFGYLALGPAALTVLDGSYIPPQVQTSTLGSSLINSRCIQRLSHPRL